MTMHMQQTLPFFWQGRRQCSLQLLIQCWLCGPGTHYSWVGRCSMEFEVCPTLVPVHMTSSDNLAPDLVILGKIPVPYMIPESYINW